MCETSFDADLPEEIDLDAEPGRIDEILSGIFFQVSCPNCGTTLKPELAVRLLSRKRHMDVQVLPELERLSFHLGEVSVPKGAELLIGFAELFERARIMADDLDPAAVEIIKYYLLLKAEEGAPDSAELSVSYAGLQEGSGKLLFHIGGIREGEIAVLPIGRDYYDRILKEVPATVKKEPFDAMFAGPYRSIKVLEAS
jgi:hypothetical protein